MKNNILFFKESLGGGGAERVLVTILKHLDYEKYSVTLLTLVDGGVLKEEIMGIPIRYMTVIRSSDKPWSKLLYKIKYKLIYKWLPIKIVNRLIIPQKHIDVYVAFTEGFATKLMSYSPQVKIAWVHADLKKDSWTIDKHIYKNLEEEKQVYSRYNEVVCVSRSVENVMMKHYELNNTTTIYNPIDVEDILQKATISTVLNVSTSFNVVSVGRLVPQKGYDLLIPMIGRLRRQGFDVQLYLIGKGIEHKHLEGLIKEDNLQEFVHLVGFLSNPYPLMSQMDLFVCSSIAEGYSLVIAEAMVLGLPIISMDCAGPNELLGGGEFGLLCDDYNALETAIEKVISDRNYYLELRKKASKRQYFFNVSKTIEQIEKLLDYL